MSVVEKKACAPRPGRALFSRKLPDLMALPADRNAAVFDALWGYYCGSGVSRPSNCVRSAQGVHPREVSLQYRHLIATRSLSVRPTRSARPSGNTRNSP